VATTAKGTLINTVSVGGNQADPDVRNNQNTLSTVVTLSNLILRTLKTPVAALPGQDIVIDDTTMNSGAVAADATVTRFYLSTNRKFDGGALFLGSRVIPPLAPRASSSGSTTVTIPLATALGRYFLIGVADADNAVVETRENNQKTQPLQVTRPDLNIASLRAPSSAAAGASITLQETTGNKSSVASEASTTKFYLSTDALLDGGDLFLDGRAVPALAAKGKNAGSTTVTIPPATAPGKYFLLAVADSDGAVAEADEGNNLRSRTVTVKP
jgi:subtilase family serine protease